jgi:hypothetical protein
MNAKQTLVTLPGELHAWLMTGKAYNVSLQAHIISLLEGLRKKGGR